MRNLILVRAGDNSLHSSWIEAKHRNFDIFISYYGQTLGTFKEEADYYDCVTGLKWKPIAHYLYTHKALFDKYDAVWFPDDDLLSSPSLISEMYDLFYQHNLWLAQPALAAGSYVQRRLTAQVPKATLRYTNFVDIMCPIFSRYALNLLGPTFSSSVSGWGLDFIWPHLLGNPEDRIAIIDKTPVIHARALKSGTFYKICSELGVNHGKEMRHVMQKYGVLEQPTLKAYKAIS